MAKKYKVWDKKTLQFYEIQEASFTCLGFSNVIAMGKKIFDCCFKLEYYEIVQYIGFNDKKGNELYEKDIVKYYNRIGVIQYSKVKPSFILFSDNQEFDIDKYVMKKLLKIGNLFENYELIKN